MEQNFVTIPCEVVEQTLKVLEYAANDVLTGRNAAVALREALERPQTDLAAAYRAELDTMSNRNYELRMENAHFNACQQQCDQASNWKLVPVEQTYRLRAEIQGPDGYDSWKDAAMAERVLRKDAECKMKDQVAYWKKRAQNIEEQMVRVKEAFACDQACVLRPVEPIGYFHMHNGVVSATQLTEKLMECMTGENGRVPLYALPPNALVELINEIERLKHVEGIKDWKLVPVEPTQEMIDRVVHLGPDVCFIYEEMLNATPELPELSDEEIEQHWYPSSSIAESGKRRVAFGRAVIERAFGKLQKGSEV